MEGNDHTMRQIEAALGQRIFVTISQATDLVFSHTEETLQYLEKISGKLTSALKYLFPGREIIALGAIEKEVDQNMNNANVIGDQK